MKKTKELSFTKEQMVLLSFLSFKSEKGDFDFNWPVLVNESLKQGCFTNILSFISEFKNNISELTMEMIMKKVCSALNHNHTIYYEESKIVSAFKDKIQYIILKGSASAAYYDNPESRMMGDIDILTDEASVNNAIKILGTLGYSKNTIENNHHLVFYKGNVWVELHFEVAGLPSNPTNKMKELLEEVFKDNVKKDLFGYDICVPSDEKQAIILLLHMRNHFYCEGLGLRHLCDWAYFVNKTANNEFWKDLLPILEENGLINLAKAFTKTCSVYLGAELPEWAVDFPENLCEKIIWEIFYCGNFGSKDNTYPDSSAFMCGVNGNGKRRKLFTVFNDGMIAKYPFVKKWFILYPFLSIYEIVKFSVKVARGKRSTISSILKAAKRRESLIYQIEQGKPV